MSYIAIGTDDRIYAIAELIRRGVDISLICNATKIDMLFLEKIKNIVVMENVLKANHSLEAISALSALVLLVGFLLKQDINI